MRIVNRGVVLCAAMLLAAAAPVAQATVIGPDAYGYKATNVVPFSWIDISGTGTPTLKGTDDSYTSGALSFTFNIYGKTFDQAYWSTNGLLTFGNYNNQSYSQSLTGDPLYPNVPAIAPLLDDWVADVSSASGVYYQTLGDPGSREFVLQWHDLRRRGDSGEHLDFEAVLFEGTNNILLQYANTDTSWAPANHGGQATVGIRDVSGDINGRVLQWSYAVLNAAPDQSAILFSTIPEPLTMAGLVLGISGLAGYVRKRRAV